MFQDHVLLHRTLTSIGLSAHLALKKPSNFLGRPPVPQFSACLQYPLLGFLLSHGYLVKKKLPLDHQFLYFSIQLCIFLDLLIILLKVVSISTILRPRMLRMRGDRHQKVFYSIDNLNLYVLNRSTIIDK